MLEIKNAKIDDIGKIMEIYRYAQDFMIRSGNPDQWGHFWPIQDVIEDDIKEGICKVICEGDEIYGVFALCQGDEPTYQHIEGGMWLNDEPYVTIHRIASDGRRHGIFKCAAEHCKKICSNVRVDTHENNKPMQRQVEKNGFIKCGTIYIENGSSRIAYHWTAK